MRQRPRRFESKYGTPSESVVLPAYVVRCVDCRAVLSDAGMKASLLAAIGTVMFSAADVTDCLQMVSHDTISNTLCKCQLCETACTGCGTTNGYHVRKICEYCATRNHNGHRYVLYPSMVSAEQHVQRRWVRWVLSDCAEPAHSVGR